MAVFGGLLLWSSAEQARFVLMARPAQAVVVRHVEKEGTTSRTEKSNVAGKGIESRMVASRYMGKAPVLRFELEGRKIEFDGRVQGVESPFAVGTALTILYDPWNPANAVLESEANGWAGVVATAFFGSVVLGGALLVMVAFGGWRRYFPNFRLS